MTARVLWIAALLAVLMAAGCGTVNAVRPLRKGESCLAVSAGEPVADAGMTMPLPYAVARYRYGVDDRLSLHAGGHLLTAGFGVAGFDVGCSYYLLTQQGWVPGIGVGGGMYGFIKPGDESRFFPELELAGSYLFGNRFLSYFGVQSMYQLDAAPAVVLAPFAGQEVRLGRNLSLSLEAKWYGPGQDASPRNVNYRLPIGGKGALGFVLGANYHLGGWYE